jgi:hypothetical protein
MPWPKILEPKPSTSNTYGGIEMSKLQDLLSGVDIAAADETNKPTLGTEFRFKSSKLKIFGSGINSSNTASFTYPEGTLSTVSNANVTFPNNLSGSQNNEFVFKDVPAIITAKTLDASLNVITHIKNENIDNSAAIDWSKINKSGSKLGDLDNVDLTGRVNHSSVYWDAVQNKWIIFQPSNGLDVYLQNLNDVFLNSPSIGQLLEYNGTIWHNVNSPQVSSISKGVYTTSGNGTNKVFSFPHGVTDATPNVAFAAARSDDAVGDFKTTVDATNITITYTGTAPPSGTNNLVWSWMCSDPFGSANNGIDVTKIVKYNQANTYGAFDQAIPSGNLKLISSGFSAALASASLGSDVIHTFPDSSQNIVGTTATQQLENKRIDALINSSGTVNFPTGPTNLLGDDTTNTLHNKTINIPDNNIITGLKNAAIDAAASIDWSKISKIGSSIADFGDMAIATPLNNQFLVYNGSKWINTSVAPGSGEINTASNVGVGGIGVFKQKTDLNFEFKNINAGSSKVTVTDDPDNNEVDIDVNPANILLQTLGGTALWSQISKTGSSLSEFGGTVVDTQIATDAVTTVKILNSNVTSGKLATDAVTDTKLAANSVITAKILDANVTAPKLATDSVITAKILDLNITAGKLAADSVTTAKILDANVTLAKLATDSVNASKIVDDSITNAEINSGAAIAKSKLAALAIVDSDISSTLSWPKISKSGSVLADIANVVLTSPSSGQSLNYNGTNWVNQTPSSGSGGINPALGPKTGQVVPGGSVVTDGSVVGSGGLCSGWKTAALTSGNITVDEDADGQFFALNTTTTSQTNAEINSVLATIFRTDLNPKIWLKIKFPVSVINTRTFIGFTDLIALPQNSSTFIANQNGFGWNYDTSSLTNIQLISNNANATPNLVDTGVVPVLNTVMTIKIEYISSSNTVQMTLNGTAFTTTTKVPASTAKLGFVCREQNTSGAIRTMNVYYMYCEQDK